MMQVFKDLDKSYYYSEQKRDLKDIIDAVQDPSVEVTYARIKLKQSNYVEPEFKVEYSLKVPDALKNRVNRAYIDFVNDCFTELEPVKKQPVDEY